MHIETIKAVWTASLKDKARLGVLSEAIIEGFYRAHVRPGDNVIDVGANAGRHTFPLAECVGADGKVFAIEALPTMMQRLKASAVKMGLPGIEFLEFAAGRESGKVTFYTVPDALALSSLKVRDNIATDHAMVPITVQMKTLDSLFGADSITFIKLDVEGAEFDVLRGARQLISRCRPAIAFEDGRGRSAELFGYTMEEFYGFFEAVSYSVFDLFGLPVGTALNKTNGPWNFFAVPKERAAEMRDYIWGAALLKLLAVPEDQSRQ